MIIDRGSAARKSKLLPATRLKIDDGGVYWTRDKENKAGSEALVILAEGIKPVSSCTWDSCVSDVR